MNRIAVLAAAALVLLSAGTAGRAATRPAGNPAPRAGAHPQGAGPAAKSAHLPDSVVARIFLAQDSVDVTDRQFHEALRQLAVPSESLTSARRRDVLGLLVQKSALNAEVAREGRHWLRADSSDYRKLAERLTLRAALDSARSGLAREFALRGDTLPAQTVLDAMLRDSAVARLHPVYDEELLERVPRLFAALPKPGRNMPIAEQYRRTSLVPAVSTADSARALVRSSMGSYTLGQLLADFSQVNPLYRPSVATAADVRALANSTVYETILLDAAARQNLVARADIAAALADRAEYLDVQRWVESHAFRDVPLDSTTLRRHFAAHPELFDTWGRADIVRTLSAQRAAADSIARSLGTAGAAESLLTKTMPGGLSYRTWLAENADTALFARVRRAGANAILGPDATQDGWRVIKVMSIEGRHPRRFEDAYAEVKADWYEREGDRRLQELLQAMQSGARVVVNEAALARDGERAPSRGAAR